MTVGALGPLVMLLGLCAWFFFLVGERQLSNAVLDCSRAQQETPQPALVAVAAGLLFDSLFKKGGKD